MVSPLFSWDNYISTFFIRPFSDGTYYGMVMSVRPSVRVSVRQSQFSALFSYMLWHIELKFGMSLSSYEHSIKFECRQFPSIFVGVMSLLKLWKSRQFSAVFSYMLWHIELQFCIWLCCTVTSDQVREWSICVNFCWKLCPFWNLEYWKYTAFRSFSLTCFEILS